MKARGRQAAQVEGAEEIHWGALGRVTVDGIRGEAEQQVRDGEMAWRASGLLVVSEKRG